MQQLAPNLPPLPARFVGLPIDDRGFPVPRFVAMVNGKWDFRVIRPGWMETCISRKACWQCGERLGKYMAFVIGPMCALNLVTSEPPCHVECARFACQACPFLTHPRRKRDTEDLPEGHVKPAGIMIARNPGVACLWVTRGYRMFRASGGLLFQIGKPESVEWYAHGRAATREEVVTSIETGLPILTEIATMDGAEALAELARARANAMALLPEA